jgi:hypothetical protein
MAATTLSAWQLACPHVRWLRAGDVGVRKCERCHASVKALRNHAAVERQLSALRARRDAR